MGGEEVEGNKKEIIMLKEKLKQLKEFSKKKEKDEKLRHQLLIQMERKLRQANGEYLPEFKNWQVDSPKAIKQSRILALSQVKSKKPKQQTKNE